MLREWQGPKVRWLEEPQNLHDVTMLIKLRKASLLIRFLFCVAK